MTDKVYLIDVWMNSDRSGWTHAIFKTEQEAKNFVKEEMKDFTNDKSGDFEINVYEVELNQIFDPFKSEVVYQFMSQ
jgi:hypothetical protein